MQFAAHVSSYAYKGRWYDPAASVDQSGSAARKLARWQSTQQPAGYTEHPIVGAHFDGVGMLALGTVDTSGNSINAALGGEITKVSSYAYKGRWYDPAASVDQSGSAARKLARWQSTQQPAGYTEHPIVGAHFDGVGMLALGTVDTSGNSINAALGGEITKVSSYAYKGRWYDPAASVDQSGSAARKLARWQSTQQPAGYTEHPIVGAHFDGVGMLALGTVDTSGNSINAALGGAITKVSSYAYKGRWYDPAASVDQSGSAARKLARWQSTQQPAGYTEHPIVGAHFDGVGMLALGTVDTSGNSINAALGGAITKVSSYAYKGRWYDPAASVDQSGSAARKLARWQSTQQPAGYTEHPIVGAHFDGVGMLALGTVDTSGNSINAALGGEITKVSSYAYKGRWYDPAASVDQSGSAARKLARWQSTQQPAGYTEHPIVGAHFDGVGMLALGTVDTSGNSINAALGGEITKVSSYAYKGRWYDPAASVDQSGSAARKLARWQSTQQPAGYTEHPIVGAHFDGVGMLALGTVDTSGNSINAALGGAITKVSSYAYKGRWYDPAASVDQSGSAARKLARWQSTQQPAGYTEHPIVGAHFDGVGMLALGTVDTSGNSINAALGGAITKVSSYAYKGRWYDPAASVDQSGSAARKLARWQSTQQPAGYTEHPIVGAHFDGVGMLALGTVDTSGNSINAALGGEITKDSYSSPAEIGLVVGDRLPPGSIQHYSIIPATRALKAWLSGADGMANGSMNAQFFSTQTRSYHLALTPGSLLPEPPIHIKYMQRLSAAEARF
ncbi:hypothetical protein V8E36_003236 [Tilletia maclaganii]